MSIRNPVIYADKINEYQEKLKPCPHCGGKAIIIICGKLNDLMYVRCGEVQCMAAPFSATPIYENSENWNKCFGLMTEKWNCRLNDNLAEEV